jgi:serine/threonine protein kinase
VLGAGEFGEVYLATQKGKSKAGTAVEVPRAVKTLKTSGATAADKNEFLREALIMLAVGKHVNVVRMVGVAVQQAPWLVVLEFMRYGDLRAVMLALEEKRIKLNMREMLNIALQLAAGCDHLATRRLVHMDLAARNVLVGDNSLVKIADFGLTRPFDQGKELIQLAEPIRIAIKWSAPESITQLKFSAASDCWSLGVTIWEVFAYGTMPWKGVTNVGVLQLIAKKKRMDKPKTCHSSAWSIIESCWHILPGKRPTFRAIKDQLKACIKQFSTQDLRDVGLLASSDAKSAGKGGNAETRPYAKLYGMIGSSEDIDADIEDVDGADAYALAVKVLGGYDYTKGSKTAPAPKSAAVPRINNKRQSLKGRPKKKAESKKAKPKAASAAGATEDYVELNEDYGWGGVEAAGATAADVSLLTQILTPDPKE